MGIWIVIIKFWQPGPRLTRFSLSVLRSASKATNERPVWRSWTWDRLPPLCRGRLLTFNLIFVPLPTPGLGAVEHQYWQIIVSPCWDYNNYIVSDTTSQLYRSGHNKMKQRCPNLHTVNLSRCPFLDCNLIRDAFKKKRQKEWHRASLVQPLPPSTREWQIQEWQVGLPKTPSLP